MEDNQKEAAKLFSVPDFVGDMCKAIASRIRGAVASVSFDDFHKVIFQCYAVQLECTCVLPVSFVYMRTCCHA